MKPVILNSYIAIIEAMNQQGNSGNRQCMIGMEDS